MRTCARCDTDKPTTAFRARPDRATKWQSWCRECEAEYRAGRIATSTAKRYNISLEQYLDMLEAGCVICGTKDRLMVDHDHDCCDGPGSCGQCVRGILCGRHNWIEGMRITVDEIMAIAAYKLQYEGVVVKV